MSRRSVRRAPRAAGEPVLTDVRLAAIDVGSNSIHMVIAQVDADGGLTTLWRLKEMVGLGRISFPSRRLSMEAMDRAVATLRRFQQETQRRQCEKVIAVATSAVREAENGGDFVARIRRDLRLPLRVISAREEARLIYLGVRHAMGWTGQRDGSALIVDVGGGSVEFIVADGGKPALLESRKLGAARMTARYVKSDPIGEDDLHALLKHYDAELAPLCERILPLRPKLAIGTSGTMETLATMCHGLGGQAGNGQTMPEGVVGWIRAKPLARVVSRLLESRSKDRARMEGLDDKRQDQIVAGALLVHELFGRLKLEEMALCRAAMREGILVDYISRHLPDLRVRRQVPDPRRRSILDLARRCDWRQEHSEHVAALAVGLFDALRSLHGLGRRQRELIEYACLLHDIGWHIAAKGHQKHSMYLILNGGLKGFSDEEVRIIANIARYHRKSEPTEDHELFAALSPKSRQVVRVGAAILRIADGLDRTHCKAITRLRARIGKNKIRLLLEGRGDMELELWAARRKMRLFTEVFDRSIAFECVER
jgi:exopolyphosphatase / guanosine-5'-triphosphate,3'-diphosphate pyrophosphatase